MRKCLRKCKGVGEVAVMEVAAQVGVRTRARALAMATASSGKTEKKRRKVGGGELKFSSSLVQLRSCRRVVVTPENSVSQAKSENSMRQTASNDPASCCSSNGSSEVAKEILKFADLEEDCGEIETSTSNFDCRERREMTPSSELRVELGELESTAKPSEANSRPRETVEKMPSDAELEEFFTAAEKDIQKQFTQKYNYDIVKDEPLEGRYEWVRLKP